MATLSWLLHLPMPTLGLLSRLKKRRRTSIPTHVTSDHVLFKIAAKVYDNETKEKYPFHSIGNQP
jgi:hypothetical protein